MTGVYGRPPRPAGGPCRSRGNRRNGACARAVWGAAQPRPGGRNCRPRGETDGSGARAVIQGARRTRGKLREGIRPNPPRREKFSSPFHTARNNFLGKYKMDETFWAFRVSIYRGACDRDAWPSRRVRRAAPAAAGGSRRNGPARCLGGARTPAPAEETAAHAVKQTARYPRAKPKERIRQKWKDILCETSCTSYRNMLYYLHQKSACGGRRGGLENPFRRQPGGNRPPDRQNSSSTNTFSSNFPSPDRRRPEKQTAANRFPFLHLPRDGARTARGQSPHRRARPPQKVVMPMIVRK